MCNESTNAYSERETTRASMVAAQRAGALQSLKLGQSINIKYFIIIIIFCFVCCRFGFHIFMCAFSSIHVPFSFLFFSLL